MNESPVSWGCRSDPGWSIWGLEENPRPGERIDNPTDNLRVGARILQDLGNRYGNDPARMATGYFSGPGNVNKGQGAAWRHDRADGNGKRVSGYVNDVMARIGQGGTQQGLGLVGAAPAAGAPVIDKGVPTQPQQAAPPAMSPLEKLTGLKQGFAAEWLEKNYGLGPGFAVRGDAPAATPGTGANAAPANASGGQKAAGLGLALASALGGGNKQRAPVEATPVDTNNYQSGFAQANDQITNDLRQRIADRWRSSMEMTA